MNGKINLFGDWAPGEKKVTQSFPPGFPILNIEGPILQNSPGNYSRLAKAGPHIFNLNFPAFDESGVAVLANNHLFDYDLEGYKETEGIIKCAGWLSVGAGRSRKEACEPVIFNWCGKRVGILARCETQFGIAQEKKSGVAAMDSGIYQKIRNLKQDADFVIVSVHAAAELLPWPSPKRQECWRALIDAGADIVHGHHAHVPQGWEEYNGGWIFYGLGNFCVDPIKWSWHPNGLWSLVPQLSLVEEKIQVDIKTTMIENLGNSIHVRQSTNDEASAHINYLKVCNKALSDRSLLEGIWQEASVKMYFNHYQDWLGFDTKKEVAIYRTIRNMVGKFMRVLRGNEQTNQQKFHKYLLPYHLFACESHCDAISTALGVIGGELDDLRTPEAKLLIEQFTINK